MLRLRRTLLGFLLLLGTLGAIAFGVSGSLASARDDVPGLEKQLAACRHDLAEDSQALATSNQILALAIKKKVVLVKSGFGVLLPISVEQARDVLIMQFVAGRITKAQLVNGLANLARAAASTVKTLIQIRDEDREARDKTAARCAEIAKKLKEAQQENPQPSETGAFPGGTATKLTLTLEGKTVVTDLKSNHQTPDHSAVAITHKSDGSTLSGSVGLNGSLPDGWEVVVYSASNKTGLQSRQHGPGEFEVPPPWVGFDASAAVDAYVCPNTSKWADGKGCTPSAQAQIDINWVKP